MAATTIGIVYATKSGTLRRWIEPDEDSDLPDKHPVSRGETMIIVDADTIKSANDIEAAVAQAIGREVPSARCVVVDKTGTVVDAIMADPDLDLIPGVTLVTSEVADVGWTLSGDVLAAPVEVGIGIAVETPPVVPGA